MLEQRDLEMLKGVMESVVRESESKIVAEMDTKMDARFQEMDAKMDARFQEMDAKMDARFRDSENKIIAEMDAKMDTRFRESENMILEDLDRVHINLGNRIDKVQKNLDELNQYYRITKLENDNAAILLKMIQDQDKTIQGQTEMIQGQTEMIQNQAKSLEELSKRVGVLENDKKSA